MDVALVFLLLIFNRCLLVGTPILIHKFPLSYQLRSAQSKPNHITMKLSCSCFDVNLDSMYRCFPFDKEFETLGNVRPKTNIERQVCKKKLFPTPFTYQN